ncbi:branched-chain amino acid ABC transporter permease [soil metagenome]
MQTTSWLSDLLALLWTGTVSGCLYALGAMGIVLIYKSSRVVNFAHGNMAGLSAFLVFGLAGGGLAQLPWGVAVLCSLGLLALLAPVAYVLIAPLVFRSDLTSTIATLGVGLMIQGATQLVFGSDVVNLDLPLPRWSAQWGPVRVTAYDVCVLGATALLIGTLYLVIDRTRVGVAFRAVAANPFASRVCGLSLRQLHAMSWAAAALLGVVSALLIVPTTFLSSTTVSSFMLQAFAAAVIGGFTSLPGAVLGGIFIGILTNLLSFYIAAEFNNSFLLVSMLALLVLRPQGLLSRSAISRA